jgi:hypothetical protein
MLIPEDDELFWEQIHELAHWYFIDPFTNETAAILWAGTVYRNAAEHEMRLFMDEFTKRALRGPLPLQDYIAMLLGWFAQSERYLTGDTIIRMQDFTHPFMELLDAAAPIDLLWAIRVSLEMLGFSVDRLDEVLRMDLGAVLGIYPLKHLYEKHPHLFSIPDDLSENDRFVLNAVLYWNIVYDNVQEVN